MTEEFATVPASLAGTGAPPWAAVLLAEIQATRRELADQARRIGELAEELAELAATVQGGRAGAVSHDEQLRDLSRRIADLEALPKRIVAWVAAVGTVATGAVAAAWAVLGLGPRPPAPHP